MAGWNLATTRLDDATLAATQLDGAWRLDLSEAFLSDANLYHSGGNERLNLAESKWGKARLHKVDLSGKGARSRERRFLPHR